ncbi:MAG: tetratricopeptide repeat protein [Burkholderiales bacterium]
MHSTEASEPQAPAELDLADALAIAVQLHRSAHIDEAEELYRRILEVEPRQPDALNFLGIVLLHRGRTDAAIELVQQSIAVDPVNPGRYNNLGNILLAAERVDEAVEAYRKAIALAPDHADAYNNLGIILRAQRRFEESVEAYQRAIAIDPSHVEAYNNYGNLLSATGDVAGAIRCYSKALTLRPHDENAKKFIAMAYAALGELDSAAAIYRKWLEEEPNHPGVKHLLAACSGEDVPPRAADTYIENTFDAFSTRFDAKLARLEYRAPELVFEAFRHALPDARRDIAALDAGCGTGLCGPLVAPYVSRLHGVDLSSGMLEQARARAVYHELVKAELTQYLQSVSAAYDLIVSADTLVYFGALEDVVQAASGALRAGGLLIFTVEKAEDSEAPSGHRLNPHGRYSHTRGYVEQTLRTAGLTALSIDDGVLRQERGEPVQGLVVTARAGAQSKADLHSPAEQAR